MQDKPVDLRVEDHRDPVGELRRLVELQGTYHRIEVADELAAAGDTEGALAEYAAAHAEQPDNAELAFWHGVALAAEGREQEAREQLALAYRDREGWRELLRRLPASGLFPDDPALLDRMTAGGSRPRAPAEDWQRPTPPTS
jgi:tetratricopeptide (TPR) repeat protein